MSASGERAHHVGQLTGGFADEYGLVWECDDDCPHPEHDDPTDDSGRTAR
jgi:hypothetical protein